MLDEVAEELVETDIAQLLANDAGWGVIRMGADRCAGVPRIHEHVLVADLALLEHVENLAGVCEARFCDDLAGQRRKPLDVFRKSRCAHNKLRLNVVHVFTDFVDLGVQREVSELPLGQRVDFSCSVLCGVEFAQHKREDCRIRQVFEWESCQIEISVRIRDTVRVDRVVQTRNRRIGIERIAWLLGRVVDVGNSQMRKSRDCSG